MTGAPPPSSASINNSTSRLGNNDDTPEVELDVVRDINYIEIDQKAGVIRFVIDGQERAVLDAEGLHVRENLNYGGALTDYGQEGFDRQAIESREERDAP